MPVKAHSPGTLAPAPRQAHGTRPLHPPSRTDRPERSAPAPALSLARARALGHDLLSRRSSELIQRGFSVEAQKGHGGIVTDIVVRERPTNAEATAQLDEALRSDSRYGAYYDHTGKLKPQYLRAHIIGWNVKQRQYVESLGLPKSMAQLQKDFEVDSDGAVFGKIKAGLRQVFYEPGNYTINTREAGDEDREALRAAGQQFQQKKKLVDLQKIFYLSYDPGLGGQGATRANVEDYISGFSSAYGVPAETLRGWPHRWPELPEPELDDEELDEGGKGIDEEELEVEGAVEIEATAPEELEPARPVRRRKLVPAPSFKALRRIIDRLEVATSAGNKFEVRALVKRYKSQRKKHVARLHLGRGSLGRLKLQNGLLRLAPLDRAVKSAIALTREA